MADTWTAKQSHPRVNGTKSGALIVSGEKAYAIGGYSSFSTDEQDCYEYDFAANTWTLKTPHGGSALEDSPIYGLINSKIYYCNRRWTGFQYTAFMWEYTIATDTWAAKTGPGTNNINNGGCAVVNDTVLHYVGPWGGAESIDHRTYTPATDTWASKAAPPIHKRTGSCAFVNGYLWYMGGILGSGGAGSILTVDRYDPTANTWSTGYADIPSSMSQCSPNAPVIGNNIIMTGGSVSPYTNHYAYNTVSNTWSTLTSVTGLGSIVGQNTAVSKTLDGTHYIYLLGGNLSGGGASSLFLRNDTVGLGGGTFTGTDGPSITPAPEVIPHRFSYLEFPGMPKEHALRAARKLNENFEAAERQLLALDPDSPTQNQQGA